MSSSTSSERPAFLPGYTKTWHNTSYPAISPSNPALSVAGKNIVITGGGSGIGSATALSYARAGAKSITLLGRRENLLKETAAKIRQVASEVKVLALKADVLDLSSLERAFTKVKNDFGTIDVLVSNAGFLANPTSVLKSDVNDWWMSFEINVLGTYNIVKAFVPFSTPGESVFLNVSSGVATLSPMPGVSAYTASKAANSKLGEHLAFELGPQGIRVVNIQPGIVETDMNLKSQSSDDSMELPALDDGGCSNFTFIYVCLLTFLIVSLPADMILWLASEEAAFLHGKFVWVNWDVEELKAKRSEIESNPHLLAIGLDGLEY
jgi:NAD(P)-dependent dehydrogenase (short-subunit alcohol dehydrogenase family)